MERDWQARDLIYHRRKSRLGAMPTHNRDVRLPIEPNAKKTVRKAKGKSPEATIGYYTYEHTDGANHMATDS